MEEAEAGRPTGDVVAWCSGLIGPAVFAPLRSRRPGRVFAVESQGFSGVLKLAGNGSAHSAEVHAYECWTPQLQGQAARLVAASAHLRAVLVSRLDGHPCTRPAPEVCWHAGRALARLQSSVPLRGPMPESFASVATADLAYWRALGADVLTPAESAVVDGAVSGFGGCDPVSLVPCHGDFAPGNWLVEDDGSWVGLIDFEHSRYDAPEADLAFLWDGALAGLPTHQAALLSGYGGLDGPGRRRLSALRVVAAVARAVGGSQAGDRRVESWGHRALQSMAG